MNEPRRRPALTPGPSPDSCVAGEGSGWGEVWMKEPRRRLALTPGPSPDSCVAGEGSGLGEVS